MNAKCDPENFRIEAALQILDHGLSKADVSRHMVESVHSLYQWIELQQRQVHVFVVFHATPPPKNAISLSLPHP